MEPPAISQPPGRRRGKAQVTTPSAVTRAQARKLATDTGSSAVTRVLTRKNATPSVTSVVRRSPRNVNEGFMHAALSDTTQRRRVTSVKKATPPATLQINEMQRIGVVDCQIDPSELTEDRLRQARDA